MTDTFDETMRSIGRSITRMSVALVGDLERHGLVSPQPKVFPDETIFPKMRLFRWLP